MRAMAGMGAAAAILMALAGPAAAQGIAPQGIAPLGNAEAALAKRGEYLAQAGDCIACHTAPGGKPMAGGLALPTPIGPIISTNITPSKTHGIGNYSYEQFADALRRGRRADGAHLYPAMPYTSYALVTDEDMRALYAYFMHSVAPVDTAPAPTALPFPFSMRLAMAGWNLLFLDAGPFRADPAQSAEWNRGAYLTRGLAHCGTCHTPRNLMMAETASRELGGGAVGLWQAPNITSDPNSGIGGWSASDLVAYLRGGHAAGKAQAAGPMAEAVDNSLRHLDEADLAAIAAFLKTVPPIHDPADTRPAFAWGAPGDDLAAIRGVGLPKDPNGMSGPQLYDAYCASCHQANGAGSFDGSLPPLFHNSALGRGNTGNLVLVTLEGVQRGQGVFMPGFRTSLSDQQIVTLGNYLLQLYGNPQARVDSPQVAALRAGGAPSLLLPLARAGMAGGVVLLFAALLLAVRRRGITPGPPPAR